MLYFFCCASAFWRVNFRFYTDIFSSIQRLFFFASSKAAPNAITAPAANPPAEIPPLQPLQPVPVLGEEAPFVELSALTESVELPESSELSDPLEFSELPESSELLSPPLASFQIAYKVLSEFKGISAPSAYIASPSALSAQPTN